MAKKTIVIVSLLMFLTTIFPINTKANLQLYSESVILIDAKSGEILFEKNSNKEMYPASITKIVTGIIAIEEGHLDDIVTVSENARNQIGTRVYLLEGEKVTLRKLVQGLLINSGNDAGTAIAEYFDGSEEAFANRMNTFVKEKIGVEHTVFKNPHGLFHPEHVTTASDMAKIAQYAMKNEEFRNIVGTKEMDWVGEGWETTLYNHHRLLWDYEGTTGIKNGWVEQSGHTLVTSASREGQDLISVTLNAGSAQYAYYDTMNLFDYGFVNFGTELLLSSNELIVSEKGKEFTVTNDLWITTKTDELYGYYVNDQGELVITRGEENFVMANAIQSNVEEVLTDSVKANNEVNATTIKTKEKSISLVWVSILLLGIFAIVLLFNNKLKRSRTKNERIEYVPLRKY